MGKELSDNDKRILALWKDGVSGSDIAQALGVTRASIMGRLFRLRGMGVSTERDRLPSSPEGKEPKVKAEKKQKVYRTKRIYYPTKANPRRKHFMTIMDLKSDSCRYIVDVCGEEGHLYCGKEQTRGSYCADHAALCYVQGSQEKTGKKFKFSYVTGVKVVSGK
jgi:GcrA cell cycle regulator